MNEHESSIPTSSDSKKELRLKEEEKKAPVVDIDEYVFKNFKDNSDVQTAYKSMRNELNQKDSNICIDYLQYFNTLILYCIPYLPVKKKN